MADPSKSELYYAALVANLEGYQHIDLPKQDAAHVNLAQLDARVRTLEAKISIVPPPPMLEPTWESFAWRLGRLKHRSLRLSIVPRPFDYEVLAAMVPSVQDVSAQRLLEIVAMAPYRGPKPAWLETKVVDEDEAFCLLLQFFAHTKGWRLKAFDPKPIDRARLYAAAAEFTYDAEVQGPAPPRMGVPRGPSPPPMALAGPLGPSGGNGPPPFSRPRPLPRTGSLRCSCRCHNRTGARSEAGSDLGSLREPSLRKRIRRRGCGWLRTLLCLKSSTPSRPIIDDDKSWHSSSTCRTVDD